ncbi:M48 family metallopeptidase [Sulfurospirillum arcachonense]|uniref:M48 family metallopeptidase n=1 Tax=Sulfurospirillum arcachonense TaxID=57666 RepID=UPI0004680D6C|nr:M48 family metallopeptidase [Sulfurospirillum arcachonense]
MNFFEAQERAKKNTFVLIFLFAFAILSSIVLLNFFLMIVWNYMEFNMLILSIDDFIKSFEWGRFLQVSLVVLALVVLASAYKLNELSQGGHIVAESLGGRLISRNSNDPSERVILNVVEEMAIASGIGVPPVYILEQEGINAFAAGLSYDDAIIGVTRGCVQKLSRDELQGVIAHEFSHIFNGDMRLNIQASGVLHGILFIGEIGYTMLDALGNSSSSKSRDDKASGTSIALAVGLGFLIIGYLGSFIGSIIKALISKQREYLADASAVQFTRNNQGIANALKKIGGNTQSSFIKNKNATTYSHFYFSNALSSSFLFSSHPPLKKRIYRLDSGWNGHYIVPDVKEVKNDFVTEKNKKREDIFKTMSTISVLSSIDDIGQPKEKHLKKSAQLIDSLPPVLLEMSKEPFSAQGLILALLASKEGEVFKEQHTILSQENRALFSMVQKALQYTPSLPKEGYLPLIQLSLTSLKMMSLNQYKTFRKIVLNWMYANFYLSFFEWNLKHLVLYPLDIYFGISKQSKDVHTHLGAIKTELEFFVSVLVSTQTTDEKEAVILFDKAKKSIGATALQFVQCRPIDYELLDKMVGQIQQAKPMLRKRILELAIACLSVDGEICVNDMQILHAIAATFRLPLLLPES